MKPYQQRVKKEKAALDKKVNDLKTFMRSEGFKRLSVSDAGLLRRQEKAMNEYSRILQERINKFK